MKILCPKCKEHRTVDVYDVLARKKSRVVCGKCRTVLMTEDDIVDYFVGESQAGWWIFD